MRCFALRVTAAAAFALGVSPVCPAQDAMTAGAGAGAGATPAPPVQTSTPPAGTKAAGTTPASPLTVDARLVIVPAVVYDKKGPVTTLAQSDFALTVDGKPQTVRYFDRDTNVPLTVGLLVDVSRSQTSVLEEEQKASQRFLETFLRPATANRPADRAFVLQFGHTAELLQDVTDSRPLLAAGLKEIGTQAPGTGDEDSEDKGSGNKGDSPSGGGSNNPNNGGSNNPGGSGGGGNNGGYGRRSGYPGGAGSGSGNGGSADGAGRSRGERASSGTVLYDSLYLASDDVLARQGGRRALVVLTDGVDRHSKESLKEAIEAVQRADTVVYAIYYKGHAESRGFPQGQRGYGGYDPYGYDPYGRYPPTTGGSTDPGTYRDPDGKKILQRLCGETGGRMFELKGKGSVEDIYKQIGEELRAQYRLGFTPSYEAAGTGYHPLQLTLTNPAGKKLDLQTRDGYYMGAAAKTH